MPRRREYDQASGARPPGQRQLRVGEELRHLLADLLRPGELLRAFARLTVIAFEEGEVTVPRPAVVQRIAAVAGAVGRLPENPDLDSRRAKE